MTAPRNSVEYLAGLPDPAAAVLAEVLDCLRTQLPGGEEVIAYQMPTFKMAGRTVVHVAAWKRHWSIYPATPAIAGQVADVAGIEVSGGTVRFPLAGPVPRDLLTRILRARLAELDL